jgi:selenide,water dikinase
MLSHLPEFPTADLLVGNSTNDDAAALRIDGTRVIVQTVDFFTPIVDDPGVFGEIAAANAVSDVYAMGAQPILGLALAMFPTDVLPMEILEEILAGGARKAVEAGFPIAGGHTIIDDVPKYGLAVTGIVDADRIVRNSTAKAGDLLYLTKPIGTGVLVAAHRASTTAGALRWLLHRGSDVDLTEAIRWMSLLNRDAAAAMVEAGVSAATDVTGYGLMGHLLEVCAGSGVGAVVTVSAVPLLQHTRELAERGFIPKGSKRNAETFRRHVESSVTELEYTLMCDAQTSGGLLIAVPPENERALVAAFERRGVFHARIGYVTDRTGTIVLRSSE